MRNRREEPKKFDSCERLQLEVQTDILDEVVEIKSPKQKELLSFLTPRSDFELGTFGRTSDFVQRKEEMKSLVLALTDDEEKHCQPSIDRFSSQRTVATVTAAGQKNLTSENGRVGAEEESKDDSRRSLPGNVGPRTLSQQHSKKKSRSNRKTGSTIGESK